MKVLLVGYTVPQSSVKGMGLGISRYIYHLGRELIKMGHETELIVRDDFKPKEKWIRTVHAPRLGWYPYPFSLKSALKNKDADVFNSDYVVTGLPLVWLGKRPCAVALHDALPFHDEYRTNLRPKDKIFMRFYDYSFNQIKARADAIIMRSENAREDLINTTDVNEDKVFVVTGGFDPEFFYPMKKERHEKIRIGYKGGLDGRKNARLLVDVFKKIASERDDVELHVAGAGANLETFRSMNIPNAKFYGYIPISEENSFLNSLDIYVYPTLGEGLGLGPLEAMACGVPVLASNTTSMPEVVGDGGVITKPTVSDFRRELEMLIDDAKLRRKIAARGLKRAKEMTWRRTAEDSLEVYKSIM